MRINACTLSLTVADIAATQRFLVDHFGYTEAIAADGFVSLTHPQAPLGIAVHELGLTVLPEAQRHVPSQGVAIAFTVDDAAREEARLRVAGVPITLPLIEQPWGEKLFQVTDPNGVIVQVLEWTTPGAVEPALSHDRNTAQTG
ncbi:VOC family protein [Nocardia sp. NPDC046473]|uniref:VOC family protein n=1 Tax=Nocardia sp. NPDC046473 TaxID=3155733 RepID=UPI0033C49468